LGTRYHYNAMRINATADMLIGSVSTVALNHIGLLVVDEIQNVVNSKNGTTIIGMLTQLINNAGISICMVGTPKSALFFGQEMMLARRSLGLIYADLYEALDFVEFARKLYPADGNVSYYDFIKDQMYFHQKDRVKDFSIRVSK
ncbi:MAG: hypothetical protein J6M92_16065, partial [Oribacterium sp.]|nr:hypothetical protein [Oribacterium sp.]